MITDKKISATPKEIALSNLLLFSKEAQDLRQSVIESNIKAQLYKSSVSKKNEVVINIAALLPGVDIEHNVSAAFDSLRSRGEIINQNGELALSEEQSKYMAAAEEEYLQSTNSDISLLMGKYKLSDTDARQLIEMALEIAAREASLDGDGLQEVTLLEFISNQGFIRKRKDLYEDLSKLAVARITQYGKTVDHIFSTNTFDIYRALGRNSDVVMMLDSSVAMPLMFGLSFGSEKSRYGIAAAVLNDLCREHNIKVIVPRCYLNEMAFHGKKAFEFIDMYNELDDDIKAILKSSGNAYLSHFSHIRENEGPAYTLSEFLKHFGLSNNSRLSFVENSIESILDSFGIGVLSTGEYSQEIRNEIGYRKQNAPSKIIDHDASVCTFLKNESNTGYIMATWDKVIIDVVEGLSRVLADTPARVIDFLSMAGGAQYESEQSFNLLTSLVYIDERKASALASKIEQINSVDKMHELKKFVDAARLKHGDTAQFVESSLEEFFVNQ